MTLHARRSTRHRLDAAPALLAALLGATAAQAADTASPDAALLDRLLARVTALEQRNAALERELRALQPTPGPSGAPPAATAAPTFGAPLDLPPPEADDDGGPTVEGTVVAVVQHAGGGGSADGRRATRLNWRADLGLGVPLGEVAGAPVQGFAQLRFGQGGGVALRPTQTGTVNSTTFGGAAAPDDAYGIVGQAGVEMAWPLDEASVVDQAGRSLTLTLGKLDVFGLFDQNAEAGDEASQFLNNVFVHNPLLDGGGDIAADAYGFAPGVRVAYSRPLDGWQWGVSAGAFAAGDGATFDGGPGGPLVLVQAELSPMQINGEARGTWRAYAWTNGRTTGLAGEPQRHIGWGLSLHQRVGRELALFGRYGRRTAGQGAFDHALTLGMSHGGRAWGRGHDRLGLAWGRLDGGASARAEENLELFYRVRLNEHLEISPDLQWIRAPGGDASAATVRVIGLRATAGF